MEFEIDLVPGTNPISTTPYRMSTLELGEEAVGRVVVEAVYQTECFKC